MAASRLQPVNEVLQEPSVPRRREAADLAVRSCYGHPKQPLANAQGRLLLQTHGRHIQKPGSPQGPTRRYAAATDVRSSHSLNAKSQMPPPDAGRWSCWHGQ